MMPSFEVLMTMWKAVILIELSGSLLKVIIIMGLKLYISGISPFFYTLTQCFQRT